MAAAPFFGGAGDWPWPVMARIIISSEFAVNIAVSRPDNINHPGRVQK
jgi:hypothetical protein